MHDRRLDPPRPQGNRQDAQRLGQSARPLALGRHRPPERLAPAARRGDRHRRRISRRRAAAPGRRRPSRPSDGPGAAGRLCRRRRDRAFLRRRPGAVRRRRRRPTRRARPRSRCRSAAIRSARCSTTGWSSTTTCTIRRATTLVGRMCVCGLSDGRVLVKALKRSQIAGHVDAAFQHRAADLRRRARLGGAGARNAAAMSGRA